MAAGNSVRQALQDLLREYMSNAGKIPSDQLDQAIDNMCRRTQDMRYVNDRTLFLKIVLSAPLIILKKAIKPKLNPKFDQCPKLY